MSFACFAVALLPVQAGITLYPYFLRHCGFTLIYYLYTSLYMSIWFSLSDPVGGSKVALRLYPEAPPSPYCAPWCMDGKGRACCVDKCGRWSEPGNEDAIVTGTSTSRLGEETTGNLN